jgi:hypothetical protein
VEVGGHSTTRSQLRVRRRRMRLGYCSCSRWRRRSVVRRNPVYDDSCPWPTW